MWDSPILGVGVDNYVSAFRTFKTREFVAQYGSELSTNNAHSSPIQIGASFGLFVFILFCAIQIWILIRALSIINSRDSKLSNLKGISIIWLLVFSQSLLSIEIIGLGVMNWVLGAVILSSNIERYSERVAPTDIKPRKLNKKVFPVWTGSLVIASMSLGSLAFIPVSIEDKAFQNVAFLQVDSPVSKELVVENYQKLSNFTLYYPNKLDAIVSNLFAAGLVGEIEKSVKELYRADKKDAYAVNLLATYYLNSEDLANEIKIREELRALDPWNEKLEVALARAYSKTGDIERLNRSIDRIKALNPDGPEYLEALALVRK